MQIGSPLRGPPDLWCWVFKRNMFEFQVTGDLRKNHIADWPIWAEYYEHEELAEIKSWGFDETLVSNRSKMNHDQIFYSIPMLDNIPDRFRIYILSEFTTAHGNKLDGYIVNDDAYAIAVFTSTGVELFNRNCTDSYMWDQPRFKVQSLNDLNEDPIFPLKYKSSIADRNGTRFKGIFDKGPDQ